MINGRDMVLLICLCTRSEELDWSVRTLASEYEMPHASVQRSLASLHAGGLIHRPQRGESSGWVVRQRVAPYLLHATRPNFPPEYLGENVRGVPAATSASPLREMLAEFGMGVPLVWPHALGESRGTGIKPLNEAVPRIALAHAEPGGPGELLALVDALRYVPGGRVRNMVIDLFESGFELPLRAGGT